eukprot:CAMPEP_0202357536 /NCGR_PEP_ID=MMETSP1126-20121109/11524_1 /ASSEMBLY_ACC=CAM_ASM_000457 /TAXON_ID=3047 /ORGANISM="Dunaliella tertiolecta, Strain CCMP1320" /LENGTH=89 /DNA_ID=CAMNT_0048950437 /DNA_START=208 /DNA_END=473 /DNA_ORIENTATION=-
MGWGEPWAAAKLWDCKGGGSEAGVWWKWPARCVLDGGGGAEDTGSAERLLDGGGAATCGTAARAAAAAGVEGVELAIDGALALGVFAPG